MEDIERLAIFITQTKKTKMELEYKKSKGPLSKRDTYLLDMCNGDLKLWEPELKKYKAQQGEGNPKGGSGE